MNEPSFQLELINFRSFSGPPVRLDFDGGFTGIVGVNNAGKSSVLRAIRDLRPVLTAVRDLTRHANRNGMHQWVNHRNSRQFPSPSLPSGERFVPASSSGTPQVRVRIKNSGLPIQGHHADTAALRRAPDGHFYLQLEASDEPIPEGALVQHRPSDELDSAGVRGGRWQIDVRAFDFTSIHRVFSLLVDTMYVGPFRNAVNIGAQDSYFDLQIGDAFIRQVARLKSGPSPEQNEAFARAIDEVRRMFGFGSLEINPAPDFKSMAFILDGLSYRDTEMGAGLMHFIMVLTNVLSKRPRLLLLDEPELNLHPALQLDFLTLLGRHVDYGVMFATHSLGLARTGSDRLYCVTRDESGTSRLDPYEATPGLAALAGQLGYSGRSDFQFSGVLLVEGSTEVRTFQQLLRLYGVEHRYVIVPMGGGDLIKADPGSELAELSRLSDTITAIVDSEKTAADEELSTRRRAFRQACEELHIECHVLERRAIENYFPDHAVQQEYGDQARALDPYEKPSDAPFDWSKKRNWRVAGRMSVDDLNGTDLGTALEGMT